MSNYNSYPQQNNQAYQGYSDYSNYNNYAAQYPNYDYYYQQNNGQYNPPTDPLAGHAPAHNAHTAQQATYSAQPVTYSAPNAQQATYSAQPVTYNAQPYNSQSAYNSQPNSYNPQPDPYNVQANAYNTQPYDQNQSNMAQWNYYGQYHNQQYQRPPPKQYRPPKIPAPIADTRPMNRFCCNRALKSVQAITQHELLHIQCPQCDFKCLKSYLEEHEEQYHGKLVNKKPSRPDGIAPANAPKLDTPEKLEAWIVERKRNWPTPKNIERRAREEAEQMARGELPLKRKAKIQQNERPNKRQIVEPVESVKKEEDDDMMDPERDAISSKDPSSMGKILLPEDRPQKKCVYFMKGRCNKGDSCSLLHEKPTKPNKKTPNMKKNPSLLFKLLEKEMLQEKSVILQCFRYIVDNNFFGKGENKHV